MVSSQSWKSIGLIRKSYAPRFIAIRMFRMSPYADTITIFSSRFSSLSRDSSVSPSITGMLISVMTMSICGSRRIASSACRPSQANRKEYLFSLICLRNF